MGRERPRSAVRLVADEADVIVVGAGPGGSAAAYHLARHGLRVLLLEKTEFPREKVCGDGLTPRAVRQLIRMGIDTSEKAGWLHNRGLRVIGGGVRLELDWPDLASFPNYGLVRTRLDFDDMLAKRAVEAGALLRTGVNVTGPVLDDDGTGHRRRGQGRPRQGARPVPRAAGDRGGRRLRQAPARDGPGQARRPPDRRGRPALLPLARSRPTTTTWSPGWSCAARRTRPAAPRLRLDLRPGRRPGQRRPRHPQLVRRRSARPTTARCSPTGSAPPPRTGACATRPTPTARSWARRCRWASTGCRTTPAG